MTKRSDIEPAGPKNWRGLSYTRKCGWVDWGHALPRNAFDLKKCILSEIAKEAPLNRISIDFDGMPAYALTFGESMTGFGYTQGKVHHWIVKKGLSRSARESAALGIFLTGSYEFEQLQSAYPYSWFTKSGFSAEDLMSDLIGFYIAFKGYPMARMRTICGEVSVAESYRIWDEYLPNGLGAIKNHRARPILFPTKEGVKSPADTSFPAELTTIRPSPEGRDWVRPEGGFIPQRFIDFRAAITVSRAGHVTGATPGSTAIPRRAAMR